MPFARALAPMRALLARAGARLLTGLRVLGASLSSFLAGTWSARRTIFEMVPRDMRTADPTRAAEFAEGYIALAGSMVELSGRNLFDIEPPTARFAASLHGFGWLRHFRAQQGRGYQAHSNPTHSHQALARQLVLDWIERRSAHPPIALTPLVAARRALAMTNQAAFLLNQADPKDYRAIMGSILADMRLAFTRRALVADPSERALIVLACASIAHALIDRKGLKRMTRTALQLALREAFLVDGGTLTRRPSDIALLLADMLALRALLDARGLPVPPQLGPAISRAMRMLRMLRHPDGSLARFQATADLSELAPDLIASIMVYDDEQANLPILARQSGFARLEAGHSVLLFDCGTPPPLAGARRAHASCLAFEWSHGQDKIITNSPMVGIGRATQGSDHRQTTAHSTLSMGNASSALFLNDQPDSPLLAAGLAVVYDRDKETSDQALLARHTGYRRRFGIDHERHVCLSDNGRVLEGRDRLLLKSGTLAKNVRVPYTIHFQLQPGLAVRRESATRLRLSSASHVIIFEAENGRLDLIDWQERPGFRDPARALQIAITSTPAEDAQVNWRFIIHSADGSARP